MLHQHRTKAYTIKIVTGTPMCVRDNFSSIGLLKRRCVPVCSGLILLIGLFFFFFFFSFLSFFPLFLSFFFSLFFFTFLIVLINLLLTSGKFYSIICIFLKSLYECILKHIPN